MNNDNSKNNNKQTIESKYIQQHLANERTFLAWIRTAIAIIGVGFLVTNLHFTSANAAFSPIGNVLVSLIGFTSVILCILAIIMATIGYVKKGNSINKQTFRSAKLSLILIGSFVILIAILFGIYIVML
ncbi:putative membrane protein [Oceanobacillus limi]|uniref:Putative membrane protein n=1 Tax=Oceanobacillus limi TaxID=930131 RepID=A0A1I0F9K8_9BACI|nr:DUF202 domain-containing protein [Oceanobacillus limi]SET54605.1 putative membrane protein [Oceanobacillus limi]